MNYHDRRKLKSYEEILTTLTSLSPTHEKDGLIFLEKHLRRISMATDLLATQLSLSDPKALPSRALVELLPAQKNYAGALKKYLESSIAVLAKKSDQ